MRQLDGFLGTLRPLLDAQGVHAAWIFGSHARGTASAESDIDLIVVAPTDRPFVERFRDYLPAIVDAGVGVDLLVYTPEEFARMQAEERPFLAALRFRQVTRRRSRRLPRRRPAPVAARGARVALEQRVLGLGIERGGRLVAHQQQRLVAHGLPSTGRG